MDNQYPISYSKQLREHLRALRKRRGLTQAQLGALVGVSQARIAEIEANPGPVSFDKLMQIFAALGTSITLREHSPTAPPDEPPKPRAGASAPSNNSTVPTTIRPNNLPPSLSSPLINSTALEQIKKASAATTVLQQLNDYSAVKKLLESTSAAERLLAEYENIRKRVELNSISSVSDEMLQRMKNASISSAALRDLHIPASVSELEELRNLLAHSKKGVW